MPTDMFRQFLKDTRTGVKGNGGKVPQKPKPKPAPRANPYSMPFKMPWGSPFETIPTYPTGPFRPPPSGPKYKPTTRPKPPMKKPAAKAPIGGRAMGPIAAKMAQASRGVGRAAPKPKGKKCSCHDKKPKSTSSSAPSGSF